MARRGIATGNTPTARRRVILGLAALPLAGCGFSPMFAEDQAAARLLGRIALDDPNTRFDYDLRDRLITRIGQASAPQYRMTIAASLGEEGRAIRADNAITRVNLDGEASFAVYPIAGDRPVFTDRVRAFSAYSTTASPFATQVAAEDAARRVARTLADQIVLRLAASADGWMS